MSSKGGDCVIKIAICDDELYCCDQIKDSILTYSIKTGIEVKTELFDSCESLITQYLSGSRFDVIFLDIEFKNSKTERMSGIEFGKKLRKLYESDNTAIIYVTSYKEYAIDSIKIRPFDYLQKPVTYEKLSEVIDLCINNYEKGKKFFEFISNKIANRIIISNIRYFESIGRKIIIHTFHNDYEFYGKLSDIAAQECLSDFIRIHKSFLVNIDYIEKFTSNSVVLYGMKHDELPISKNNKREVNERLLRR